MQETILKIGRQYSSHPVHYHFQRKFIDWKKTKLFGFRWNWDEEKKLRGIRLQISSLPQPSPHMFMADNDALSDLGGGGQDFVDTMYYCSDFMNTQYWKINFFSKSIHFAFLKG